MIFLSEKDKRDGHKLLESIQCKQIDNVKEMLESGISPVKKQSLFQSLDSPLVCSVQTRSLELVKLLLDYGAPVNEKGKRKTTALEYACFFEEAEIAKVLLEHKADIIFFKTIYQADSALYYNNEKIIRLLMIYQVDPIPLLEAHHYRLSLPVLNLLIEGVGHRVPKYILDFWERLKATERKYGKC
ncbi:ankyrin repeat domain-containing protein [Xanthocytophaga agilis]|uniref:Ankyrin repeat domain-containing protein n=1 Tax=Xanthocytophaga agilis TaxID=3048010 RepID=A0AAE3UDR1_9BACT|nr:ankyrin repeat domain-containing protein [Xanthocytophaga agilis]MDJ1499472.1 ankyrin repeat domain-containing protein [Xanthocytophaga agilis]